MLILCSECGKEFSDKSESCPNCGCPLEKMDFSNQCIINGKVYDLTNTLKFLPQEDSSCHEDNIINITMAIYDVAKLSWEESKRLARIIVENRAIPDKFDGEEMIRPIIHSTVPKCPRCGSTSITTGARGVNFTWGLIGASKTVNRCAKCGHTWKPKK